MRRLIFGCGYLGQRIAALWQMQGDTVYVVSRHSEKCDVLQQCGYLPIVADVTQPSSLASLPGVDTLLFAVGYDKQSSHSIQDVYETGFHNVITQMGKDVSRVIYISSTGVYGGGVGQVVNEESPCKPDRPGGAASLAAEKVLLKSQLGHCAIILRLAGIYGPDRLPRLDELRQGTPIAADPDAYVNLIHVDDAAAITTLVAHAASTPCIYNVSDGQPVLRRDYLGCLAECIRAPAPRFANPADAAILRGRGGDKKISNEKLMRDFHPRFLYPTYREGLKHALSPPAS